MTTTTIENMLIKDQDKSFLTLSNTSNSSLANALRKESFAQLANATFPTKKEEDWKFFNINSIVEKTYTLSTQFDIKEKDKVSSYINKKEINIVFVNGRLSKDLSTFVHLPKGVQIYSLNEIKDESRIKKILDKYKNTQENPFILLNKSFYQDAIVIDVDSKAVIKELIHIVHIVSNPQAQQIVLPRTLVILNKSSEISVLESHISFDEQVCYFSNALTDILIDENSTLHYCKAQKEGLNAYHMGSTRVWQEANSNFNGFTLIAGGAITRNNFDVVLNAEGCSSVLNGLYSLYGNQQVDNHTCVDHRYPNCVSNQLYKGILNGSAHAIFNGKIFVKPIAQKTNSYQLNKHLLLGKNAKIDTKPQLEIFADDVKCTHGATIGQLSEAELFYLQTRCIPQNLAKQMLARGFMDELLNTLNNESINQRLHKLIEPSFAQFE